MLRLRLRLDAGAGWCSGSGSGAGVHADAATRASHAVVADAAAAASTGSGACSGAGLGSGLGAGLGSVDTASEVPVSGSVSGSDSDSGMMYSFHGLQTFTHVLQHNRLCSGPIGLSYPCKYHFPSRWHLQRGQYIEKTLDLVWVLSFWFSAAIIGRRRGCTHKHDIGMHLTVLIVLN